MENLTELIRAVFLFFNRKNIKKYLIGEFEPTVEELTEIEEFLIRILETDELKKIEKNYSNALKREIEQKKIAYLKELSVEELDFLLAQQMGLDEILQVIFAKGGLAKGFASIQWNNETKQYEHANTDVKLKNIGGYLYVIILICSTFFFGLIFSGYYLPAIIIICGILFMPVIFITENTYRTGKKLAEKYPNIFGK